MDGKTKVKVSSLVNGRVVLRLSNQNFLREWTKKGQIVTIPYEVLEEAMFTPGFANMIKNGTLYIEDLEAMKALGLEEDDATVPVNYKKYTEDEIKELVLKADYEEFKENFETMPEEQKLELRDWAITLRMRDDKKVSLIEKYFNFNMDNAIRVDRQMNEGT